MKGEKALKLHYEDHVAIAKTDLPAGDSVILEDGTKITAGNDIPSGHKIALLSIKPGGPVRKFGQIIGFATRDIEPGEHIHSHNLSAPQYSREYEFGTEVVPVNFVPEKDRRTFQGLERPDGRVGTRNYIAVISTVNCSAYVTRQIAARFTPDRLAGYPNIDGVIPITHHGGCSTKIGSLDYIYLQRALAGVAQHPNVGGYILIGLGCEVNQIDNLIANYHLQAASASARDSAGPAPPFATTIQQEGGVEKTISAGVQAVERMLPEVNRAARSEQPVSKLNLGLQCGGSDGWSGITANPLLGRVSDKLVAQGGTVVLAETPEIYGAEQLLLHRAVSREVGQKLVDFVHWWEQKTRQHDMEIDNNPSPGNKAGGLTTIYEKSLGAIAKAGSTPLNEVYGYAEQVTAKGACFMDTPGNDWISATGQAAGGCNLIVFTTGRGSVFGFKPAPSIKISTNTPLYDHMTEDMDFNGGRVIEGETMDNLTDELFDLIVSVASGQQSKSEAQGIGEDEFCPWPIGGIL